MLCNRAASRITICSIFLFLFCKAACATDSEYSANLYGMIGLNTVPSARMDPVGTVRLGIGTLDPYLHGYAGFQLAGPLFINIRQSAEISNILSNPDRLYPGADIKLRLLNESRARPEIAIGLQSAVGHKRMAGEYVALSKRYKDFDFTAGLGWGRLGSAGHLGNPLKVLSSHFGKSRAPDGEMPNGPEDWFTGEDIGIFGGVEYFTSVKGLSIKLDYGADGYKAEEAASDYNAPALWGAGVVYRPAEWASLGIAMQGKDKVMGRLTLEGQVQKWRDRTAQDEPAWPMRPYRTGLALPGDMELSAQRERLVLQDTQAGPFSAKTQLLLKPGVSTPAQIGRAIPHMANHAGPEIEEFTFTPVMLGLQGTSVRVLRRDFEQALVRHQGSPEEVWLHTHFGTEEKTPLKRPNRLFEFTQGIGNAHVRLENELSLAEEDTGALYRTSFLAGLRGPKLFGWFDSGFDLRLNISDNLVRLRDYRPPASYPVRSDVDLFARNTLSMDRLYTAFTHSVRDDLHMALTAGYLEEMYAGYGGEILYRPFRSRFALGAEGWVAAKRDPYIEGNLGLTGIRTATGHINGWYDIPRYDTTLQARIGSYLAGDLGGTLALEKKFKNGARLKGFVTVTDNADFDLFGGATNAYNGLELSVPLGGFKYMPRNSAIVTKVASLGRETGQALEPPLSLYELTEPFSYDHMAQYWDRIVQQPKAQ